MTETKENCRKQTGNLKINNVLYPIYEGLNIIGRDVKATIILKETVFSKLHAAISVVDLNTHLICDLNSSNGTQLGKTKLEPYQFYPVKDHEPIIFGDVVGMYFKGTELLQNNCVVMKVSSQNVDHEASTQILNNVNTVENIHELPTQEFETNIHEAPTQIFPEKNIHEAPTQIFPEKNIHEAPTQLFPEKNIHEAPTQIFPEKNIHEAPTQIFANIHEVSTQYFNPNDSKLKENEEENTSNYNINDSDEDATQDLVPEEKNQNDKDLEVPQTQEEDILSRTDVYDDIFANESFRASMERSAAEIEAVEVDETIFIQSQKEFKKPQDEMGDDDDIILSTQDSEAIDRKFQEHQEELNSSADKLAKKVQDVCDSDATDVEDEDLLMANILSVAPTPEIQKERPEETAELVVNEVVIENEAQGNCSDEEEVDLLALSVSKSESNTEESVPNNANEKEETVAVNKKEDTVTANESDDETDDELPATQLLHLKTQIQRTETHDEDIYYAATQKLSTDPVINEEVTLTSANPKSEENEMPPPKIPEKTTNDADDNIYSAATQLLPPEIGEEEDIYAAATQILPLENVTSKNDEERVFSAATQILAPESLATLKQQKNQAKNDDENIYSAATQVLAPETSETLKPQKNQVENDEENIYSAATQILPTEETKEASEDENDHIFSAATQLLPPTKENDIFSAPTQLLLCADEPEEQTDDIFLAPTQILLENNDEEKKEEDEEEEVLKKSSGNSIRLSYESKDESMRLHLSESEQSISNLNQQQQQQQQDTETQLEVSFDLETQKLYVEEKTRRPDNPLSHMFAEEATEQFDAEANNDDKNEESNTMKLTPIVSVVDIKKSKITLKDIQEASTSKIKKSYVKLERIKQEPTRRSNRNQKPVEETKTPKRRTKIVASETSTPKETTTKEETKPSIRRRTRNLPPPVESPIQKETIEENSEDADFKSTTSSRHNTRGKRRDYKSIAKGNFENEAENKITSKSFMREKIEELEIHVKEEKTSNNTDSDDSVSLSKRAKRNNHNKVKEEITVEDTDDCSSIEINIRKKVPRIEDSQPEQPKRNIKTRRTKQEEASSEESTSRKSTRQTVKTKKSSDPILIEDSDESILETFNKTKKPKIEVIEEPTNGRTTRTQETKRRNNIVSPERNKAASNAANDICLNTPNSKRRKYEPLCVNISSSQLNKEPEHKIVFTMLNDNNSLETMVRKLGGAVIDSIHSCTVLVTNKISRSLKFLIAIALGKPIVHVKWIHESDKKKKFLDPWDYLLEDTESEDKFQMSLKQSLMTSKTKKLLAGETILLAATKNFQVLKEIIETSGGKCIMRAPPKNTRAFVVCYEDERQKYSKYLKQKMFIVVSAEAIFSGVLQQKLNWKQYILT